MLLSVFRSNVVFFKKEIIVPTKVLFSPLYFNFPRYAGWVFQ